MTCKTGSEIFHLVLFDVILVKFGRQKEANHKQEHREQRQDSEKNKLQR